MFMQAGFAMVESGACRAKNVQNILLKNLTDVCVGTLGWWLSGWAFAYGGPKVDGLLENKFIGTEQFFGSGFMSRTTDGTNQLEPTGSIKEWFFQWAFCGAASTIVSGGVAERVNFPGYCFFSFLMTAFIYPVCVAWTWGYGFLAGSDDGISAVGYMDFAGSGIVHMAGGFGALVGAAIAGPRMGRWDNPDGFDPHSLPLIVLGTMILWFGWYGFNCGSTLGMTTASQGMMAAQVAMNTTIAGATGGLVVFTLRLAMLRKYDIGGFCNGILAGLVSITAGCGNVEVGPAFVIAVIGGLLYQGASVLLRKVKVDDPIDAFPVHGACGAWGTIAAALFDWGEGFDQYHGWSGWSCFMKDGQCAKGVWGGGLASNVVQVLAIASWVCAWSAIIFAPLRLGGFLRASNSVQEEGFDAAKHSPSKAYQMDTSDANAILSA
jgi:Amt family ammonium transporter